MPLIGFDEIIGQGHIIDNMKSALRENRVSHAYVFSGSAGIGKRTVARSFAAALLCENPVENGACGICNVCAQLAANNCLDLYEVNIEERRIVVDLIRNLQSDMIKRPLYSRRKVYIINNAETMTGEAQNALLKTLEEPPSYVVLILLTSNYDALYPTIKSRAVRYSFQRNTRDEVLLILEKKLGANHPGMNFLVAYADGAAGSALNVCASEGLLEANGEIFDIILKLKKGGIGAIINSYAFFDKYKEEYGVIANMMRFAYRDFLNARIGGNECGLINSDKKDMILGNAPEFSATALLNCIDAIDESERMLNANTNFELMIKVMLLKLQEEMNR